ncbi:MAG: GDYXXLXY domain-containing protein [Flavobacteriales bacterium]|nr:GDYXXLXY domain-containing protein [Flavobacteriales bacterium]
MNKKVIVLLCFTLISFGFIGASIWKQESILINGEVLKFRTAPLDPNDFLRGKYVRLSFAQRSCDCDISLSYDQPVYVTFEMDEDGFAKPKQIHTQIPEESYLKTKARKSYNSDMCWVELPFNRFYMEESKAPLAESILRSRDEETVYAEVMLKDGKARIKDVYVDGQSISEYVALQMENPN